MMPYTKELKGDLQEFHSMMKDFINCKYSGKCNELKEKDEQIRKYEIDIKLLKEAEQSAKYRNGQLVENLNQYREIVDKNVQLEGIINQLQKTKRDLESSLSTEREIHNTEKHNWENELLSIKDKHQSEIEHIKKQSHEDAIYMKDSFIMEIRELERKISNVEDELAFTRLNHDEVLKQSKKVYEETVKKKDKEITALKEELNYWRQRNFFYPPSNKPRDNFQKKEIMQQNSKSFGNLKKPETFNKKHVHFQNDHYQEINKQNEEGHGQDQQNDNENCFENNKINTNEVEEKIDSNNEVLNTNYDDNCNDDTNYYCNTYKPKEELNQNLTSNFMRNNSNKKKQSNNMTENKLNNSKCETQENFSSPSNQDTKPKAFVSPLRKKVKFPVIKKKRLLNPNQDFL